MIKEEFKSNPGTYSVSANRDQLEKTNPKITINGTLIPVLERYDWWETTKAIPDEAQMRTNIRKNRVTTFSIAILKLLSCTTFCAKAAWLLCVTGLIDVKIQQSFR